MLFDRIIERKKSAKTAFPPGYLNGLYAFPLVAMHFIYNANLGKMLENPIYILKNIVFVNKCSYIVIQTS